MFGNITQQLSQEHRCWIKQNGKCYQAQSDAAPNHPSWIQVFNIYIIENARTRKQIAWKWCQKRKSSPFLKRSENMSKISHTVLTANITQNNVGGAIPIFAKRSLQRRLTTWRFGVFFKPFERGALHTIATLSYRLHSIELARRLNEQDRCCISLEIEFLDWEDRRHNYKNACEHKRARVW